MRTFNMLFKSSWTFLVTIILAFGLVGCEGDDGSDGAAGAAGTAGTDGAAGQSCWDLNANGVGDLPDEDLNGDGVVDAFDCNASADPVAAAVDAAKPESCATCHDDAGIAHQATYDSYADPSTLALTIDSVVSVADGAGGFNLTMGFSITKDGAPYIDPVGSPASVESTSFYVVEYDSTTGEFLNAGGSFFAITSLDASLAASNGNGTYTLTENVSYDPTVYAGGAIVGKVADGRLDIEDNQAAKRIAMYADTASASFAIGDIGTYASVANVDGCIACHGAPYRKHGNIDAMVTGVPDFVHCKGCHNDEAPGGHPEWQYMVDEPFNWATMVTATADYTYSRTIMNDTHMSHAMEFPYPQSMATCNTCHAGFLTQVLDNSNFTAETCQSCHAIQGIDAWPQTFDAAGNEMLDEDGDSIVQDYFQPHRAPAFDYLWIRGADLTFHDVEAFPDCQGCHGAGIARALNEYHTGYDPTIYDATGTRWDDQVNISIDQITRSGNLLTVNFSSTNISVVPELLVSFYGWDSKHFLVGSHERDANPACSGFRPGCKMEYVPESSGGGTNPLFTEDPASAPGAWMVTLDMAALQTVNTDDIPTLIANNDVSKVEVTITPELKLGGVDVVLSAVDETFDLGASTLVVDYFKGANATVDIDKCNACHDALASSFHDGSGRSGDGVEVCKNCHTTTFAGSHLEMASRGIDSYVHAIHTFQPFDEDDVASADDPVYDERNALHKTHRFPNFTALSCEGCHKDGTYNVPDQSESMPGLLSASWDIADRSIGTVPEAVTGPASRACGGCHRAEYVKLDSAGDLVSFNAHTEAFGTYVENDTENNPPDDPDDEVVFGVVDKIMSLFE